MGEKLKSALELAMERLGVAGEELSSALDEEQKRRIAELRKRTAAKIAEREILHKAELAKLAGLPPAEARIRGEKLQEEFVRERRRLERERDAKIEKVRRRNTETPEEAT